MSLFAYNLTGSPVALAAGSPIITLPASASPPARGKAFNVTAEIRPNLTVDPANGKAGGVSGAGYALLQAQVANGQVWFEWTADPEYLTTGLTVSTPADEDPAVVKSTIASLHVYADGTLGSDANNGLQRSAGTGGSFSVLAGVITFTGTGAAWTAGDVGKLITINYATNPGNNGSFLITGVPAANQITYVNARGVTEAMPAGGKWAVSSPKKTLAAVHALMPYMVQHNSTLHLSGTFVDVAAYPLEKLVAGGVLLVVDGGTATTPISMIVGTGVSFATPVGVTILLNAAPGTNFTTNLAGKLIDITGATTQANTGLFTITTVMSPTQLLLTRGSGVFTAEAYTGNFFILPFDTTINGTGDSLTFTGGPNTVDLVDAGASFTAADLGKQITLVGSTTPANDGTFTITAVISATQIQFVNAVGVTEAFTGTWSLGGWLVNATRSGVDHLSVAGLTWKRDQNLGTWIEVLGATAVGQNRLCVGYDEAVTNAAPVNGAGDSFAFDGVNLVTLTDAGAAFNQLMIGTTITIAGSTTPANNGTFTILDVLSTTQVTYTNALGVAEAFAGTWTLKRGFSYNPVGNIVTLTDAGAEFSPRLVNKRITISGSTSPLGNDGTFVVTAVLSPTQLTYINNTGVTEDFPGTWTTQDWFTPVRDFSAVPTQFRLVRPTTKLTVGQISPKNDGLGNMQLQNLTLEGTSRIWTNNSPGLVMYSHLLGNGNSTSIPYQCGMSASFQLSGHRYNPYTYAQENVNTTSQVGVSAFIQQQGAVSMVTGRVQVVMVAHSYLPAWPCLSLPCVTIQQGTRVGAINMFNCGNATGATAFGAVLTTTGYARTRFTGIEIANATFTTMFNAAFGLVNSNIYLGSGVDFTTLPKVEIGLELIRGFVYSVPTPSITPTVPTGVASKIGMYIHSGSCFMEYLGSTMPTLRGKTIGDISVNRTTRKSTWEAANLATVSDTTEMSIVKKGAVALY